MSKKIEKMFEQGTSTIVCVTDQFNCQRIIEAGRKIADKNNTPLYVISVVNVSRNKFASTDVAALEHLFNISKQNNAVMTIIYGSNPIKIITDFISEHSGQNVLTGLPENEQSVLNPIWEHLPQCNFYVVDKDGEIITNKKIAVLK